MPPKSKAPQTEEIDDSWDDLIGGALGGEADTSSIFDRATAVPVQPEPHHISLASDPPPPPARRIDVDPLQLPSSPPVLGSEPPDSGGPSPARSASPWGARAVVPAAPTAGPARHQLPATDAPHGGPMPLPRTGTGAQPDRRRTSPEPFVERHLDRARAEVKASAPRPASDPFELDLNTPHESPLDLADRKSTESLPEPTAEARIPGAASSEGGSLQDMQDRYAVGDFTGALVVAESLLDADPQNDDALRYAQSCREVLTQMYAARIGSMDQIAVVAVPQEQITWLSLDHRAGFLLSLIDGVSSVEEILDISGMTRLDALRIMYTLVQLNVITLSH